MPGEWRAKRVFDAIHRRIDIFIYRKFRSDVSTPVYYYHGLLRAGRFRVVNHRKSLYYTHPTSDLVPARGAGRQVLVVCA